LKDLIFDTTSNKNVHRVRLAVARAEIYRKNKGLGLGVTVSNSNNKNLDTTKEILIPVKQDRLPIGPLGLLKIRHNDVLDRYLNQKVRIGMMVTVLSLFYFGLS
jgi:hypothetical protein